MNRSNLDSNRWFTEEELLAQKGKYRPPPPPPYQRPIVILACCTRDEELAIKQLQWIAEMGQVQADMFLLCSKHCNTRQLLHDGANAFRSAKWLPDNEDRQSNWREGGLDASGTNSMFRQAAYYAYLVHKPLSPWMWLEADAVPMVPDWYERLNAEYERAKKPCMGDYIDSNVPHLSGVAIYPAKLPEFFPEMVHPNIGGNAFDVAAHAKVLANAHRTLLIQDGWRSKGVTAAKIRPEAVLYHASKDGALIDELRNKKNGGDATCATQHERSSLPPVPVLKALDQESHRLNLQAAQSTVASNGAVEFDPSSAPTVDIYIKTWSRDHELLMLCLKSIEKFVTGYRNVIVVNDGEIGTKFRSTNLPLRLIISTDQEPGYLWQQKEKLSCHRYSDADYFLWVDSDCCFNRPFDVSEFFVNGKTKWRYTPLNLARPDQTSTWVPVMRKFLGMEPTEEYMREHPTLVPRWLLEEMDKFCLYKHGMPIGEYVMAQADPTNPLALNFSEINCAGFFARKFHADKFEWVPDHLATPCLVQGFTHAGPERIQQDIEKHKQILGDWKPVSESEDWSLDLGELEKEFPCRYQTPLETALAILKAEAAKSPLHKARLTKKIQAMGKKPEKAKSKKRGPNKTGTYQDLVDGLNEHAAEKANKKTCPKCRGGGMVQLYPVPVKCDCGAIYKPVQPKKKRGRPAKKKLPGTGGNHAAFGDTSPEAIEIATRNIIVGTRPA